MRTVSLQNLAQIFARISFPNLVRHLNTSCKNANDSKKCARHFVQTFRTVFIVAFRAKKSTEF